MLIHGMGRTPLSMLCLRRRLRQQGHRVHLFGYLPAIESLAGVTRRLVKRIQEKIGVRPYVLGGHSLGCVLIRHAWPQLQAPPRRCFFMAPPMRVCRAATYFAPNWVYRLVTGEMGQLLAQDSFMTQLSLPARLTIYAGTAGPRGKWYPLADEVNDSILTLSEASAAPPVRMVQVPCLHTFIMCTAWVSADILEILRNLERTDYPE